MMVSMTIAPTTAEERELLRKAGFVHVTGLKCFREDGYETDYVIGQSLRLSEVGHWDYNNGWLVAITMSGEVWLAVGTSAGAPSQMFDARDEVLKKICPRGEGAFVPCSNGEHAQMHDLLGRFADPDWEPKY